MLVEDFGEEGKGGSVGVFEVGDHDGCRVGWGIEGGCGCGKEWQTSGL